MLRSLTSLLVRAHSRVQAHPPAPEHDLPAPELVPIPFDNGSQDPFDDLFNDPGFAPSPSPGASSYSPSLSVVPSLELLQTSLRNPNMEIIRSHWAPTGRPRAP